MATRCGQLLLIKQLGKKLPGGKDIPLECSYDMARLFTYTPRRATSWRWWSSLDYGRVLTEKEDGDSHLDYERHRIYRRAVGKLGAMACPRTPRPELHLHGIRPLTTPFYMRGLREFERQPLHEGN